MKTLFVDMDNVITDFSQAVCTWYNDVLCLPRYKERYKTDLTPVDLEEYSVSKNYELPSGLGKELSTKMFADPEFWHMDFMLGASNILRTLNKKYELYIATAPQYNGVCIEEKVDWIKVHLPFFNLDHLILTHSKGILHGDIMIDDDWRHLMSFQGKRVLFLQPYNRQCWERFGYVVKNWKEIKELLYGAV